MKEQIFIFIFGLCSITLFAQNPNFEWGGHMGGTHWDRGNSIAADDSGNVYTTGTFYGSSDFDPGNGIKTLNTLGWGDVFLQKLDSNGTLVWAKSYGSPSNNDKGIAIATDNKGFVYVMGHFFDNADLDPGIGVQQVRAVNNKDVFLQKFDGAGNLIWVKTFGGTVETGWAMAIDGNNNIIIAGSFMGTVDFDPGPGVANRTSIRHEDGFILKLDNNGIFMWVQSLAGGNTRCRAIDTDNAGNVFSTGTYYGTVDFDPGSGVTNISSVGNDDIFILKLSPNGSYNWAIGLEINRKAPNIGSAGVGTCIKVDPNGNVYASGYFIGIIDFNPGPLTAFHTSDGRTSGYILKLNTMGHFIWVKRSRAKSYVGSNTLNIDAFGNIYTTGTFRGTVDFDPNGGVFNLTSTNSSTDIFIQKLNSNGGFIMALNYSASILALPNSLALDKSGNIYTIGDFKGTIDVDPGIGSKIFSSMHNQFEDIYIQKLSPCESYTTLNRTACERFHWSTNNKTYDKSGSYVETLKNRSNCDSIITLNLTIYQPTSDTTFVIRCVDYTWPLNNKTYSSSGIYSEIFIDNKGCDSIRVIHLSINQNDTTIDLTSCGSFFWEANGNTYANSGTYTKTLTNTKGCDSIVTLRLIVNKKNNTYAIDKHIACEQFKWIDGKTYFESNTTATYILRNSIGCDSIITLGLTINKSTSSTDVQNACSPFTWIDGKAYSASNNRATHTVVNSHGCDSVITLNLNVEHVNSKVVKLGGYLTLTEVADSYQWIKCPEMSPMSDASKISYVVPSKGDYAVIVEKNGCVDTSDCHAVLQNEKVYNDLCNGLLIYPNPTFGNFSIDLGIEYKLITIAITNVNGQQIKVMNYQECQLIDLEFNELPGVYFVTVKSGIPTLGDECIKAVLPLVRIK